ncbi:MAG: nuclear transport factor 2 family protein [Polyangiaceae bacterium]
MSNKILTTLSMLSALALITACEEPPKPTTTAPTVAPTATQTAKPEAEKPKVVTGEELAKNVQAWTKAWDTGDIEKLKTLSSPKVSYESVDALPPMKTEGHEAMAKAHAMMKAAFSEMKNEVGLILVNGQDVAMLGSTHGKNDGELMGKPATNKELNMPTGVVMTAGKDGKIESMREFMDQGTFAAQLGLMPAEHAAHMRMSWDASRWGGTKVVVAKNDDTEKKNLALAKGWTANFNGHDVDKVMESYADDAQFIYAGHKEDVTGKEAIGKMLGEFYGMSSDVKSKVEQRWAAGDYVVSVYTLSGTNDGAMPGGGPPATNKSFEHQELEVTKVVDGKVAEQWMFSNGYKMAVQLGLTPDPSAQAKAGDGDAENKPATAPPAD